MKKLKETAKNYDNALDEHLVIATLGCLMGVYSVLNSGDKIRAYIRSKIKKEEE